MRCELSEDLKGLRVCQINATAAGGGVAELLSRLVPIYLALGITADWRPIYGDKDFFTITKSFHNTLQGMRAQLTQDPMQFPAGYEDYLVESAEDCAAKVMFLLENHKVAEGFGRAGQAKIRTEFLLPRLIRDELRFAKKIVA